MLPSCKPPLVGPRGTPLCCPGLRPWPPSSLGFGSKWMVYQSVLDTRALSRGLSSAWGPAGSKAVPLLPPGPALSHSLLRPLVAPPAPGMSRAPCHPQSCAPAPGIRFFSHPPHISGRQLHIQCGCCRQPRLPAPSLGDNLM